MPPKRKAADYLKLNGSPIDDGRGIALPPGIPRKPDWIAAQRVASAVWDETLSDLADVPGLLSTLDGGALALYCDSWQTFRDAAALVAKHGMIATNEKGAEYQHPAVGIRNRALSNIVKLGAMFGLNPVARDGMIVSGPTAEDELANLIK